MPTRTETDSLGAIQVPSDRYWGAQTQRSLENFPIGEERFPRAFIKALATVKLAAARANQSLGVLPADKANAIAAAAQEVIEGQLDDHFPLKIWQTGSGTQTNMNANEVIANRAIEILGGVLGSKTPIHPNDHVNLSQSSNDVFPTAMHLAATQELVQDLLPALEQLTHALQRQAERFVKVIKIGRTHLMDAVPITLGQEFSGYVRQLEDNNDRLRQGLEGLRALPIGGTAVGTGLNAPEGFAEAAAKQLSLLSGLTFYASDNKFAGIAAHDVFVSLSGSLKALAISLTKIAGDIRWLGSGPRAGLSELRLPVNEPGSSIMPGKVNPTQAEALLQVCAQVIGNDTAITLGGMNGRFELNVAKPLIIRNLLHSIELLSAGMRSFTERCVEGLEVDQANVQAYLDRSLMLVTALTPSIGYDKAAEIAKQAHATGRTLREIALESGAISQAEFDRLLDPSKMV